MAALVLRFDNGLPHMRAIDRHLKPRADSVRREGLPLTESAQDIRAVELRGENSCEPALPRSDMREPRVSIMGIPASYESEAVPLLQRVEDEVARDPAPHGALHIGRFTLAVHGRDLGDRFELGIRRVCPIDCDGLAG